MTAAKSRKRNYCRSDRHEMTPENVRVEVVVVRGVAYRCRRCKACQTERFKIWYRKRKEEVSCATSDQSSAVPAC